MANLFLCHSSFIRADSNTNWLIRTENRHKSNKPYIIKLEHQLFYLLIFAFDKWKRVWIKFNRYGCNTETSFGIISHFIFREILRHLSYKKHNFSFWHYASHLFATARLQHIICFPQFISSHRMIKVNKINEFIHIHERECNAITCCN